MGLDVNDALFTIILDLFIPTIQNARVKSTWKISFCSSLDVDQITWVITVPAIWSDAAKQFMEEAILRVCVTSIKLNVVLDYFLHGPFIFI